MFAHVLSLFAQYIEEFKHLPTSPLLGYQLAHQSGGQTDDVRHFGFSCIEDAVKFRWSEYGADERAKLRDLVADLVKTVGSLFEDARRGPS